MNAERKGSLDLLQKRRRLEAVKMYRWNDLRWGDLVGNVSPSLKLWPRNYWNKNVVIKFSKVSKLK